MNQNPPPAGWPTPAFVVFGLTALSLALGFALGVLVSSRRRASGAGEGAETADETRRKVEKQAVSLLRNRRHAYLNHLQVISGWLQLGNLDRAIASLEQALEGMERENRFIRAADPSLVALILAKEEKARSRGLELEAAIDAGLTAAEEIAAAVQPDLGDILDRVIESAPRSGGRVSLDLYGTEEAYSAAIKPPDGMTELPGIPARPATIASPGRRRRRETTVERAGDGRLIITWRRPSGS